MNQELQKGTEALKSILESGRILKLSGPEPLPGRLAFHFVARAYGKEWPFSLSNEALSDLPAMKGYQQGALALARALENRFRSAASNGFFCASGVPVEVQVQWPMEPLPSKAASFVRVEVADMRNGRVAQIFVVITHQQSMFELKQNPFAVHGGIVNSIRLSVDSGLITFHPPEAQPKDLQRVELTLGWGATASAQLIDRFLTGKVFWLAFKVRDSDSQVWVADPWDAEYLGASVAALKQASQILDARSELRLQADTEFASIGRALLVQARKFEHRDIVAHDRPAPAGHGGWDVFVSHASEDKELFVRPLAEALRNRGFRVWFDEYALRLGDSLRRTIDRGLTECRFGVVVLSPRFFAKEWPQRELDGLVSRESSGQKVILPVWHEVSFDDVRKYSPTLADRFAVSSSDGLAKVVDEIVRVLQDRAADSDPHSGEAARAASAPSVLDGSLPRSPVRGAAIVRGSVFVEFKPYLSYTPTVRITSQVWSPNYWSDHEVEVTNVSPHGFTASIIEKSTREIDALGWGSCTVGWTAEP